MENAIRLVLGTMVFTLLCVSLVIQLRQRKGGRDQDASQNEAAEARRRAANELEELRREVRTLRALLDRHARGLTVTSAMVEDGQVWEDVDGDEAQRRVEAGALPLDVRTEVEVRSGVVPGALWIPMDQIEGRLDELPRDRPLLVYCAAGARSAAVCEFLAQSAEFPDLLNLDTGVPGWPGPLAPPDTTLA